MSSADIKRELQALPTIDWETLLSTGSGPYGLTEAGYVPKPFARLVVEGLALAERLFGPDIDIGPGSVLRKVIEMSALEHARTYALLSGVVDDLTIPTARGDALSRLGEELGLPRPYGAAQGQIKLVYVGGFTPARTSVILPAGLRLLTPGGHHVALDESVKFSPQRTEVEVPVSAFHPGPEHNLDPAVAAQKIQRWNPGDPALQVLNDIAASMGAGKSADDACRVEHTVALTGGEQRWPDDRYRQLLLRAPRSVWTAEAMTLAVSLVPGVRQAKLVDLQGGLDVDLPLFGSFAFGERVFGTERDLASPYYFTVMVAPTPSAIWDGADGLAALVAETLEDLRPVAVYPEIRQASELFVGVEAELVIDGLPLGSGSRAALNASPAAQALKRRIASRLQGYIDHLGFGEAVSPAKVSWLIMNQPGVADVRNLRLKRCPRPESGLDFSAAVAGGQASLLGCGESLRPTADQVAVYVDDLDDLRIV